MTADFERFAIRWIELVEQHGGTNHGYFLPAEGAGDMTFPPKEAPQAIRYLEQGHALVLNVSNRTDMGFPS